jgi:hypothetical protein
VSPTIQAKKTRKASDTLVRKRDEHARALRERFHRRNRLPGAAIGTEYGSIKEVDHSGPYPVPLSNKLQQELIKIAPLGKEGLCKNRVGCCCEVRAANELITKRSFLRIDQLVFTDAIRPQTGQFLKRCANCIAVFG